MGRRPDPPGVVAAKGNPSKLKKETVKGRLTEARRVAKLLAEAPAESARPLAPPKFLDERFPAALAVWRNLAPRLSETHRLAKLHRGTFAMFCVYYAEWVAANEDIAKHGFYQVVETVVGGAMERIRPIVKIREIAFANCMTLSSEFGLTPADEYALFRDQRLAAQNNADLFDEAETPEEPVAEASQEPVRRSIVGSLGAMDGIPPGQRAN